MKDQRDLRDPVLLGERIQRIANEEREKQEFNRTRYGTHRIPLSDIVDQHAAELLTVPDYSHEEGPVEKYLGGVIEVRQDEIHPED